MNRTRAQLIMAVIALAACTPGFAQSKAKAARSARWAHRPTTTIIAPVSRPTKVSGDGLQTPSGVKYWDILTGRGDPAVRGHVVKVLFSAWVENGRLFDSSTSPDKPTIFTLGVGQVIRGWEEGMEGMRVGGKRQLRIPPELAYGAAGIPSVVPPDSTLIFDIELVGLD